MSFLKFLKRDKKKEPLLEKLDSDSLDIPPAPPGLDTPSTLPDLGKENIEELPELPELPDMEDNDDLSPIEDEPLPDLELASEKPLPELEIPKPKPFTESNLPELPSPRMEEGMMEGEAPKIPQPSRPLFPISKPGFGVQENVHEPPKFEEPEIPKQKPEMRPYERLERTAVRDQRAVLEHKKVDETIYLRVDRFRDILTGTNTIKSNLKIASDSIVKLNEIDVNRDKVFEKWRNVLVDLQKKLIFVDKTLFKR